MIEIRLLEQLSALEEHGTLSAAAVKLHTSQSALTRSMKKLESELGVELFHRAKNRITLNKTGRKAAEYARQVLAAGRDFEDKTRAFDRQERTLSVGFCAPVPQAVLTPILNDVFDTMTLSIDMSDDSTFPDRLRDGTYQLAVLHYAPQDPDLYALKCGHEDLFLSVREGDPLSRKAEISLRELDGLSILLLTRIGFWANFHRDKTPGTRYLRQIEPDSYTELAANSAYPTFSSGYYIRRGETLPGRVNIPIPDPECHTDFYLVCPVAEKEKYKKLFARIREDTIR